MQVLQKRKRRHYRRFLNNASLEEAVAEVFEFEDASLNDKSKLPATVENIEGFKASNQGSTSSEPVSSSLKTKQIIQT